MHRSSAAQSRALFRHDLFVLLAGLVYLKWVVLIIAVGDPVPGVMPHVMALLALLASCGVLAFICLKLSPNP